MPQAIDWCDINDMPYTTSNDIDCTLFVVYMIIGDQNQLIEHAQRHKKLYTQYLYAVHSTVVYETQINVIVCQKHREIILLTIMAFKVQREYTHTHFSLCPKAAHASPKEKSTKTREEKKMAKKSNENVNC